MNHDQFVSKYLGQFVETRNDSYEALNQCVDLVLRYAVDVWNIPLSVDNLPRGNAIKWGQGTYISAAYGNWVVNGPNNIAPQGSIIVFRGPTSAGHIAIVDSADADNVTVIEQNGGGMANQGDSLNEKRRAINCVRRHTHLKYAYVMGWYERIYIFPWRKGSSCYA